MINSLEDFIKLLDYNNIFYELSVYHFVDFVYPCVIIKKNKYLLYVYFNSKLYYDLSDCSFTLGFGLIDDIKLFNLLDKYFSLDLKKNIQLSLF